MKGRAYASAWINESVVHLFHECTLTSSVSEAKRLARQGGLRINDKKIDPHTKLTREWLTSNPLLLQRGKRRLWLELDYSGIRFVRLVDNEV